MRSVWPIQMNCERSVMSVVYSSTY
ncbi:RAS p21 protein activator 1 [Phyllostomus discolor]|uniref:RAS p21 protein activator 1 n=1 Tax=Phyllostomus discolor TaxID=89673 RepID=A0A834EMV4_9CHIR|nr:RAS p21 protein activator 1 [Phyllostomus discolor]